LKTEKVHGVAHTLPDKQEHQLQLLLMNVFSQSLHKSEMTCCGDTVCLGFVINSEIN